MCKILLLKLIDDYCMINDVSNFDCYLIKECFVYGFDRRKK